MNIELKENKQFGDYAIVIDGVDVGGFNKVDRSEQCFAFYPINQHKITGSQLIEIGKSLNKLNSATK